jgi:indole-3-glycerol phosphate synthase
MPIIAKDLIVDPLQIARAACDGARAVLLVEAACLPDLPALLDTCTLLGLEALVEIHTPDELTVAAECGAGLLLINERDRATGKLILGQAIGLAPLLPPDATCLACGGLSRLDQVRMLRRAGYDGFVLGRALLGDPRIADALMTALMAEEPIQRAVELISVPKGLTNRSGGRGGEEALGLDGGAASPQPPRSPPMSGTSSIGDLGI